MVIFFMNLNIPFIKKIFLSSIVSPVTAFTITWLLIKINVLGLPDGLPILADDSMAGFVMSSSFIFIFGSIPMFFIGGPIMYLIEYKLWNGFLVHLLVGTFAGNWGFHFIVYSDPMAVFSAPSAHVWLAFIISAVIPYFIFHGFKIHLWRSSDMFAGLRKEK